MERPALMESFQTSTCVHLPPPHEQARTPPKKKEHHWFKEGSQQETHPGVRSSFGTLCTCSASSRRRWKRFDVKRSWNPTKLYKKGDLDVYNEHYLSSNETSYIPITNYMFNSIHFCWKEKTWRFCSFNSFRWYWAAQRGEACVGTSCHWSRGKLLPSAGEIFFPVGVMAENEEVVKKSDFILKRF